MFELIGAAALIMAGWGIADFLNGVLSKNSGPYYTNFWGSVFIFLITLPVYLVFFYPKTISPGYWPTIAAYSLLVVGSFWSFLKALQAGKVSLIVPICSAYGILSMMLSMLFLRETLQPNQIAGIIISTAGLILVTINFAEIRRLKVNTEVAGLKYAILTFILWGIIFTFAAKIVKDTDWFTPFFFASFITIPVAFALMLLKERRIRLPDRRILPTYLLAAITGQGAFLTYAVSLSKFPSALLAPISAGYPALTVILAHYFLKERITMLQYFGTGLIIAGLIVAAA